MLMLWPQALEQFSRTHPHLVVRVTFVGQGEIDTVIIYRGMASSLARSTPADLNTPVIPASAEFVSLDLLPAPYDPTKVLHANLTWEQTRQMLRQAGIPV